MKKSFASKFLMVILCTFFVIGIVIVVSLPMMLDFYFLMLYDAYSVRESYHRFITIFLMFEGTLGLTILWQLISMIRTIENNPFVMKNVNIMRRIGILASIMAVTFLLKGCWYFTIMTLACGLMLILLGLVAFTLCDLLRQAVSYKEENDLTI